MRRRSIGVLVPSPQLMGGGERHGLTTAAALAGEHDVTVYSRQPVDAASLGEYFGLDLSGISFRELPGFPLPARVLLRFNRAPRLAERLREWSTFRWLRAKRHDYFINVWHYSTMPNPAPRGMFLCMFPRQFSGRERGRGAIDRQLARLGVASGVAAMDTYTCWAANSDYTAGWIGRYWGERPVERLYPPCEDMSEPGIERGRSIVSVGRFFPHDNPAENNKRQDVLIEAFRTLPDLHAQGWALHLVGSLSESPRHRAHYDELVAAASGLPVEFHANASLDDVRRLYNSSAMYWHATGFGTDAERYPAAQEHFGITPVEAMSAGCVPLVYSSAGPADNVDDGVDGREWTTVDELAAQARDLASDEGKWARMSAAARTKASGYDRSSFITNARRIVSADLP